jgi:two-component system alkaline phosphatase synthesis response regulator PhoP
MKRRLLLVEDEPALVMTLTDRLLAEGFAVESVPDGDSAMARATQESFDLIILDVMLSGLSGFEVCRRLRQDRIHTPILMLTARAQVADRVEGLQLGADDYLIKPFDMAELLARIHALLRRAGAPPLSAAQPHQFGSIRVDFRSAEVTRNGRPVPLSAREFQLLRYLIEHRGALIPREQLLQDVWGYQPNLSTRTVDVHMAWLRQKLEDNPKNPQFLLTVRGLGYKFAG